MVKHPVSQPAREQHVQTGKQGPPPLPTSSRPAPQPATPWTGLDPANGHMYAFIKYRQVYTNFQLISYFDLQTSLQIINRFKAFFRTISKGKKATFLLKACQEAL